MQQAVNRVNIKNVKLRWEKFLLIMNKEKTAISRFSVDIDGMSPLFRQPLDDMVGYVLHTQEKASTSIMQSALYGESALYYYR